MMKTLTLIIILHISLFMLHSAAQDTFSIVAVDTVTGQIGSAGASCIDEGQITGGAIIISDILPGRGAIHTQSYWNTTNQQNAHARMEEGLSPQEIIDWLVDNDAGNNPAVRQYGIVDTDSLGQPRSAAFTGANCLDYKNHITGPNYSIQGNILLGQEILDSMEARFLNTEGTLAEKLMASLQGANVPGADSRCAGEGVSSLSAFIRVAWPWDTTGVFYCDLNVPSTPYGVEPIDSLQVLFDEWLGMIVGVREQALFDDLVIYPNPARDWLILESRQSSVFSLQSGNNEEILTMKILNSLGTEVESIMVQRSQIENYKIDISDFSPGFYILVLKGRNITLQEKFIILK